MRLTSPPARSSTARPLEAAHKTGRRGYWPAMSKGWLSFGFVRFFVGIGYRGRVVAAT